MQFDGEYRFHETVGAPDDTSPWYTIGFLSARCLILICCVVSAGCSLPGDSTYTLEPAFPGRAEYVGFIESYLEGKERAKVEYSAEQLRRTTSGEGRPLGQTGAARSGNYEYGSSNVVLTSNYSEDFQRDKFTLPELDRIYRVVEALRNDPEFRRQLGRVISLIRARRVVSIHGLRKDNSHGKFSVDYARSEPGGAIVVEDGKPGILFCEPAYVKGDASYLGTTNCLRAADIGTFHGHKSHAGPTARDLIANQLSRNNSFIITDMGDEDGSYLANINFLAGDGDGLDLGVVRLPPVSPD